MSCLNYCQEEKGPLPHGMPSACLSMCVPTEGYSLLVMMMAELSLCHQQKAPVVSINKGTCQCVVSGAPPVAVDAVHSVLSMASMVGCLWPHQQE